MKKQQTAGNLDAIRAKWKRNVVDGNDVPALLASIDELERERDEARAQVERLRAEAASSLAMARIAGDKHDQKCAEVDVLRGVGCNVDGDGPCGACRKCAYRRGAEAMRLACQQWCRAWENNGNAIADALADLRLEGKP